MSNIYFLMGVSGSGKTTVLNASGILHQNTFKYIPSYTTRPLRPGEVNGEKYHHISHALCEEGIKNDEFLEWAVVHKDYLYGTKYGDLVEPLKQGINTIKEIEIYGLIRIQEEGRIKDMYTTIFLDIPEEVMIQRIQQRGAVSEDELKKRLESAIFEKNEAKKRCDICIDASVPLEQVVQAFQQAVGLTGNT